MLDEMAGFAQRLADAARAETLIRRGSLAVEDKNPGGAHDPVTEADRAAERAMRALIEQAYPDHGIAGEEFATKAGAGRYCWSLDPIDGTRSFTCGLPTWVTLVALLENGRPVVGLIDAPCLDERYVARPGSAELHSRGTATPLRVSECRSLADARLSTTDPYLFAGAGAEAFDRLRRQARTLRLGHDGYAYARLAAGGIDLVVEAGLKAHDYQALVPVVRGAGGVFGHWSGGEDVSAGEVIAAATRDLYDAAVAIMKAAA